MHSQQQLPSWSEQHSPLALCDIWRSDKSVAVWRRKTNPVINDYFAAVFPALGMGLRQLCEMATLQQDLERLLPAGEGKAEAIADIYLLADMLTCLFACQQVGLRIVAMSEPMCPDFHTDKLEVRLVSTYLGQGTEWLPLENLAPDLQNAPPQQLLSYLNESDSTPQEVEQLTGFDVALLKGSCWPRQAQLGAIHRSCPLSGNERRVLLSLDPC